MAANSKKLFAGPRLRRIRRELGLTQTRMAEELNVSVSYLNLIERNQRPLTAQFILKLADVYNVDIRTFAGEDDDQSFAELHEVFSERLFQDHPIPRQEMRDLAETCPSAAQAIIKLYRAYNSAVRSDEQSSHALHRDRESTLAVSPIDQVRDYIRTNRNYFPSLDEAAEHLYDELMPQTDELFHAIRDRLRAKHGIHVRIMPVDVMSQSLRRYDRHRKQLLISELLSPSSRTFQAAYQLGLMEFSALLDQTVEASGFTDDTVRRLARINFANYIAGALHMPYRRFIESAENVAYDIELLGCRFGASFEQTCHRLTTLQRPSARGIPFFMVRIDNAGNVSKRFSAGRFHFSQYGGTCPLWNIHSTFKIPGRTFTQVIEMPDGTQYFSVARTVRRMVSPSGQGEHQDDQDLAIGLGCELKYADRLIYASGLDLKNPEATPIGVNCSLCERLNCSQRSGPPLSKPLIVDEGARDQSPFTFADH